MAKSHCAFSLFLSLNEYELIIYTKPSTPILMRDFSPNGPTELCWVNGNPYDGHTLREVIEET